jgi:hypothetical protein
MLQAVGCVNPIPMIPIKQLAHFLHSRLGGQSFAPTTSTIYLLAKNIANCTT